MIVVVWRITDGAGLSEGGGVGMGEVWLRRSVPFI